MPHFIDLLQIIVALPVSIILTKVTILFSQRVGFINHPNSIVETHKAPIAYGGGLAIGLTVILFLSFQATQYEFAYEYFYLIIPFLLIGLSDDIYKFNPLVKFLSQLLTLLPLIILYSDIWLLHLVIFSLFILTSQNAWNLIDVMDGVTAGISAIVFLSISLILLLNGHLEFSIVFTAIIAMSALGFLYWNKYPAKIFLGETGTMLLGSMYAVMVIKTFILDKITGLFLLLLGTIPFFELIFLIIVRTRKGIPFFRGSPDHFSLRMLNKFSVKSIHDKVILFCIINSFSIILASLTKSLTIFFICCGLELLVSIFAYNYFNSLPSKNN